MKVLKSKEKKNLAIERWTIILQVPTLLEQLHFHPINDKLEAYLGYKLYERSSLLYTEDQIKV
jgi:hypothetical protein